MPRQWCAWLWSGVACNIVNKYHRLVYGCVFFGCVQHVDDCACDAYGSRISDDEADAARRGV
eukprot:scaffold14183_cov67-Attheya_sp.AAC.7